MRWWPALGLVLAVAVALALRLPHLDRRPLHTDESVHTIKFKGLWDEGVYRYDPHEYHGPSLYYATWLLARASGAGSFATTEIGLYRLVTVLFGVGLILLLPFLADGIGRGAVFWGGLFTAASPAMVFYSRYYIHEMLLVFFTLLLMVAAWRRVQGGSLAWCFAAGTGLGLMHATKETFVFQLAAMAAAAAATWGHERFLLGQAPALRDIIWRGRRCAGWAALTAVVVSVVLFTAFFAHGRGVIDSVATYGPWFARAEGQSPHVHPGDYYLGLLAYTRRGTGPVWSEGLLLGLAVLGFGAALVRRELPGMKAPLVRFIGFYTVLLTVLYSAIPYKTPWCLLGFLSGAILMAGVGAAVLLHALGRRPWQVVGVALLLAGTGQLAGQAWRASQDYADSPRNPYVYAQTLSDLEDLSTMVAALAGVHPQHEDMVVQVVAKGGDYWPLPWYLRRMRRVGWWDQPAAEEVRAPVVIATPSFAAPLAPALEATHEAVGYFGLRPGVFLQLYVERGLWERHLKARVEAAPAAAAP